VWTPLGRCSRLSWPSRLCRIERRQPFKLNNQGSLIHRQLERDSLRRFCSARIGALPSTGYERSARIRATNAIMTCRTAGLVCLLTSAAAAACSGSGTGRESRAPTCRPYDPVAAKQGFDGRVGRITLQNDHDRAARVDVYHPDGDGSVELHWTVAPRSAVDLGGGFGSDWGIRVGSECAAALGPIARWPGGTFALRWDGTHLTPGDPGASAVHQIRADEREP
jgi:hypothetical protein